MVDNGGDLEDVPGATVLSPGRNLGFAAGANLGASHATGDVLVFLNQDTVVAEGAIAALAEAAADPDVGVAMARLRLLDDPDLLNTDGNVVHVSGLAWVGGHGEPAERLREVREVPYPTGAAMAIRARLFHELGAFTSELFMYLEDLELGWKARLRGLRIVVTPEADVFHDYEFGRNPGKLYLVERNRLVFVLSSYSWRLLLLLAPVLAAAEAGILALAWREHWARDKARGWAWCARNAAWLARHRRATQRLRRVPDRELARFLTPVIDPTVVAMPRVIPVANKLLRAYWSVVRKAL